MTEEARNQDVYELPGDCIVCPDRENCQKGMNDLPPKRIIVADMDDMFDRMEIFDTQFNDLLEDANKKLNPKELVFFCLMLSKKFRFLAEAMMADGLPLPDLLKSLFSDCASVPELRKKLGR